MEKNLYRERIEAYLDNKMGKKQRKSFEAELESDHRLQLELLRYSLATETPSSPVDPQIQSTANEIRQEAGDLPEPQLGIWDKIVLTISDWPGWKTGLVFLLPLMILTLLGLQAVKGGGLEVRNYTESAYCPGQAGADNTEEPDLTPFIQAANLYCGNDPEAIAKLNQMIEDCAGFCIAQYYLAYELLEAEQYSAAVQQLAACQANQAVLTRYRFFSSYEENKSRLNLIAASYAIDRQEESALAKLNDLLPNLPIGSDLHTKAQQFYQDLLKHTQILPF